MRSPRSAITANAPRSRSSPTIWVENRNLKAPEEGEGGPGAQGGRKTLRAPWAARARQIKPSYRADNRAPAKARSFSASPDPLPSGSVEAPEWLREFGQKVLSPKADVLEHVIAELVQLLARTGAPTSEPNGSDELPDHCQRCDTRRVGATLFQLCERRYESHCSRAN